MFSYIHWKVIASGLAWLGGVLGLMMLMSFIDSKKQAAECTQVKVSIEGTYAYIDRAEINRLLSSAQGVLVGKKLTTISTQKIEDILKANPFVEQAKVYFDIDGILYVRITQREPLLRVFNFFNQDFYIDRKGFKMPVSKVFATHALVATGFIMESFSNRLDTLKTNLAKDLVSIASFIECDSLWSQQIQQLYVNADMELELVPRVGDHKIILGTADSIENKFSKLLLCYKKILPRLGWETYKTINLKYANQIVCEKATLDPIGTQASIMNQPFNYRSTTALSTGEKTRKH